MEDGIRGRILEEVWRRGLIGEWRERKLITGERREETAEDDRRTGDLSINYNTAATRDSRRNSMQTKTHNMGKETISIWRITQKRLDREKKTNPQTGLKEWWGVKNPQKGLLNMIWAGSRAAFQPLCADIPACQAASSAYPTDDVVEGPGSVPTHTNTEALWVGMRRWLCGQGPVWVSQHCRANTCLDFTTKPLRPLSRWAQRLLCRFHFGSSGSLVWVWAQQRCHGALEWEVKQTDVVAKDTTGFFYILLGPDVYSALAATQNLNDILYPFSCQPWPKVYFKYMKLKPGCFQSFFSVCTYLQFTQAV